MKNSEKILSTLRAAVERSPENAPLRRHLAETLLGYGFAVEAEQEFRATLALEPRSPEVKVWLAQAMQQQGKHGEALMVVEEMMATCDPPAAAYVLHAVLLLGEGKREQAIEQYKTGVLGDPSVADEALEERLGLPARKVRANGDGQERVTPEDIADVLGGVPKKPTIAFADVGGMEALKEEIRLKIIHPLAHRELFEAYGQAAGGGILLYGPPGCGKTLMARATAGEIKSPFMPVGINEVLDMWLGNSEKNIHDVFAMARRNTPCVLFFDEVDALGASRGDLRQSAVRQTVNQFLEEMDGVKASNEGVLILAATNAPWHIDSAFRRPGRFDQVLFVPPPDPEARAAILGVLLQGKPVDRIDCAHVASMTQGFSGADLKSVVDTAARAKLQQAIQTGRREPLTTKDLLQAAGAHQATTTEWMQTAKNYVRYANQGGLYDDVARYLAH